MLVLSATGAPASVVKRLVCDIKNPPWMDGERRADRSLSRPGRSADHPAEILRPERGLLIGENIGLDITKGRLGSVPATLAL
jgi:hypothetical protein